MHDPVNTAILARAPIPGTTKTRLIPAIGARAAARLHRAMVLRTLRTTMQAKLGGDIVLWASPTIEHYFFKALKKYGHICMQQADGDLGIRMQAALLASLPTPTILVGTDCPSITPAHLQEAATALRNGHDAVFLPAEDGGYGLIGLRSTAPTALFDSITWGTDTVMASTRQRLKEIGFTWAEPATIWDIDKPIDLKRLKELDCSFHLPLRE